jgi:hypothetical protein
MFNKFYLNQLYIFNLVVNNSIFLFKQVSCEETIGNTFKLIHIELCFIDVEAFDRSCQTGKCERRRLVIIWNNYMHLGVVTENALNNWEDSNGERHVTFWKNALNASKTWKCKIFNMHAKEKHTSEEKKRLFLKWLVSVFRSCLARLFIDLSSTSK